MDDMEARAGAPMDEAQFQEVVPVSNDAPMRIQSTGRATVAQKMALPRDIAKIKNNIKIYAAEAGEDWYYRWPTKNKDGTVGWVEGPSIDCAEAVAALFGNNDIYCDVRDAGTHWLFMAHYTDLETGFNLTRPFQQRKAQSVGKKMDAERQQDIIFQIGASKATRNVITNAVRTWTNFAFQEAKQNLVEKIGKNLNFYRGKVVDRLNDMKIPLPRVERIYARKIGEFLAPDLAKVIAEIKAIDEGMASRDECYPATPEEQAQHMENAEQSNAKVTATVDWGAQLDEIMPGLEAAKSMDDLQKLMDENEGVIKELISSAPNEVKAQWGREYARLITRFTKEEEAAEQKAKKEPKEEALKPSFEVPEVPIPTRAGFPDWSQFHEDLLAVLARLGTPEEFVVFEKKNSANITAMAAQLSPRSILAWIEKGKKKKAK